MAKMLPTYIDVSTISNAERRMFDLFRNDPVTDEWVVLHSLGLASRGRKPYGEIDFVVLIPGEGIFCLEVKGGRVACQDGQWETTDRNGKITKLKRSPFIQAREGMFALLDSISKRMGPNITKSFVYGYAVVMPDIDFDLQSPEWHSCEVIDNKVLKRPLSSALITLVKERQKYNRSAGKEPTRETIKELQQVLRPDFEIIMTRGVEVEGDRSQVVTANRRTVCDA